MKNVLSKHAKTALLILSLALNFSVFTYDVFSQKIKIKKSETPAFMKSGDEYFADEEYEILVLINRERAERGLSQLVSDNAVAKIARDYSEKMAKENFFSHFESNGDSVLERARAARLKHWSKIGENLFSVENLRNFNEFAVEHWMKSPTHRENILSKEWTTTGIGIAESDTGEIFITQVFIKR